MNTKSKNQTQNKKVTLEQLDRSELLSLIKQMIQIHPDLAQLIDALPDTHQELQHAPFNLELYRTTVDQIFSTTDRTKWGSESRAAKPLFELMKTIDEAIKQQYYATAISLSELIIQAILDNYDSFRWHAEEGQLDEVVEACIDKLDTCLHALTDQALRTHILHILCAVYDFDTNLPNDELVMSRKLPSFLIRHTTTDERKHLATWARKTYNLTIDWHRDNISNVYDRAVELLLGLEADSIDDETFLRICRETENYPYLIERLLIRNHHQEALAEAQQANTYDIPEIADIFREQGHAADAIRLVEENSPQPPDRRMK